VPIVWNAGSGTFFVGTIHDGSIYRGSPDDPTVRVFLEGHPGRSATGIGIAGERLVVAGGMYGDIRLYDLKTRARAGNFDTGPDEFLYRLHVIDAGDVWITDAVRPALWHLPRSRSPPARARRPRSPSPPRHPTSKDRTTSRASSL
jgi:hypothetical protein